MVSSSHTVRSNLQRSDDLVETWHLAHWAHGRREFNSPSVGKSANSVPLLQLRHTGPDFFDHTCVIALPRVSRVGSPKPHARELSRHSLAYTYANLLASSVAAVD